MITFKHIIMVTATFRNSYTNLENEMPKIAILF